MENFIKTYWEKYPKEKEIDPTIEQIKYIAESNKYILGNYSLVIYSDYGDHIRIIFYCFDGKHDSYSELKKAFAEHRAFVSKFNKPIIMDNIKDVFNRKSIIDNSTRRLK